MYYQFERIKQSLESDNLNYFLQNSISKLTSYGSVQQLAKTLADNFIQTHIDRENKTNQLRSRPKRGALPSLNLKSPLKYQSQSKQVKQTIRLDKLVKIPPPIVDSAYQYSYLLGTGNNHELVRRVMDTRKEWHQCKSTTRVHFRWQQSSTGYKYFKMNAYNPHRSLVNHFEFHNQISNKKNLLLNMTLHCDSTHRNVFDILPVTFVIDFDDPQIESQINCFLHFYNSHSPSPITQDELLAKKAEIKRRLRIPPAREKRYLDYQMRDTFLGPDYLWLLKPTGLNRGRGINVFTGIDQFADLLSSQSEKHGDAIKCTSFVVQKYIERPLLINRRKFDIRVWVLVDQDLNCFFFKEGYARTASEEFATSDVNNQFVHLTNNAIQKYSQKYGNLEAGNQLSFDMLQKLFKVDFRGNILPKMKETAYLAMCSVGSTLNRNNRRNCMEIFGFDYFLDEQFNVYLIEVNTNPCIEESSPLLEELLPRMLDDAFSLTLDQIFNVVKGKTPFHVRKYQDSENMWEWLGSLKE